MQKTAILFAGQGVQTLGMGKDLAEQFSSAKAWFERANDVLGYDLTSICFNGPDSELTKTEHAQPGILLVSWVAFRLLLERRPDFRFHAAAGLSLGEFTALAAADTFTFDDALRVVRERGRFMQEACDVTKGGMAAVIGIEESVLRGVCQEAGVEVANLNCPGQIVISGETKKIAHACELAKARGAKRALPLPVAGAYHSRLMAGVQPKLECLLTTIPMKSPTAPVISNVTARPHNDAAEIRQRLVEQITAPVRWEESIRFLLADGFSRFVELGPGTALSGFLKRIDKNTQILNVTDVASLEATVNSLES